MALKTVCLVFFITPFWITGAWAQTPTLSPQAFNVGQKWVWAYSQWDQDSQTWQDPYLYEKYQVTARQGDLISIEMSSAPQLQDQADPHHKFLVNIQKCLEAGKSLASFRQFFIEFYSQSFGQGWSLVSKKHKALAFTEKFNCFSGQQNFETKTFEIEKDILPAFHWLDWPIGDWPTESWYSMESDSPRSGVLVERVLENYRAQLVLQ